MVVQHLKQIEKVKKLGKWVPRELTKNKNHCFEVTSSLILCKRRQFLGWIEMCNEKWILYDNQWWPGQWMDWEAKALLKVKLVPKKVKVSVWWSAVTWSTTAFWILVKSLHLKSMLSKLMICTKNCNSCSIDQQKGSNSSPQKCSSACHTTNASEVQWTWLWSFASSAIFTWPLVNQLPLLQASRQLFVGKMLPQPAGGRKCFPKVCWILKHRFFSYRNKPTYFLLVKMCWF